MTAFLSKTSVLFFIVIATMLGASESQGTGVNETRNSHLTCFPAENPDGKFNAIIHLHANEYQKEYDLKKCKVFYQKTELCIPSTKEVRRFSSDSKPVGDQLPEDKPIYNDFLCYRMRCSDANILPDAQSVICQFGKHSLRFDHNYARFKVCIPAWKLDDNDRPILLKY